MKLANTYKTRFAWIMSYCTAQYYILLLYPINYVYYIDGAMWFLWFFFYLQIKFKSNNVIMTDTLIGHTAAEDTMRQY